MEQLLYYGFSTGLPEPEGMPYFRSEQAFLRIPSSNPGRLNDILGKRVYHTAGFGVSFSTDSGTISLRAKLQKYEDMDHMPRSGAAGFDFYLRGAGGNYRFYKNTRSEQCAEEIYSKIYTGREGRMTEWKIYFPLYSGVETFEIGISPEAHIFPTIQKSKQQTVLFYGSSITQGGCASRPGNAYPALITRKLGCAQVNFGFSGGARGEEEMAGIVSDTDADVYVIDYDYNAPDAAFLEKTHSRFCSIIRGRRPFSPMVLISKPDTDADPGFMDRRAVIYETYKKALEAGDKNIYFIDGSKLFGKTGRDACTVDGTHPNDIGFYRMAERIHPMIRMILNSGK